MPLRPFRSQPFRALRAGLHRLLGWAYYQIGAHEHARDRFERVLEIRGDDFTSYVYLGRLAYSDGDYAGWRRECELALRTSPERFAKLRHPFDLHVPRSATGPSRSFEDAGERASWRSFRLGKIRSGLTGDRVPQDQTISGDLLEGLSLEDPGFDGLGLDGLDPSQFDFGASKRIRTGDDFVSTNEREHFRHLGPMSRDEIHDVDLDELGRRLTE